MIYIILIFIRKYIFVYDIKDVKMIFLIYKDEINKKINIREIKKLLFILY